MELRDFVRAPAITCPPQASIADVASLMREYDIGSVVVADEHGHVVGIATDRDITVRGVSRSLGPETPIAEVMTPDVMWVDEDADVFEAATRMATGCLRRLPVLDATGGLVGVVSLDDLASLFMTQVMKLVRVVDTEAARSATATPTLEPRNANVG